MTAPVAFCTIVAKNYLAYARVLMASVRRHHPEAEAYVLVIDDLAGLFDPDAEPYRVLALHDLALPRPREFCFRYDVLELATGVKPFLMDELLRRGHERVIYLDPDILVLRPLAPVEDALRTSEIVLTPHLLAPLDDGRKPDEQDILRAGAYNLGFLALRDGSEARRLLSWWKERCETQCVVDPARGLFVDQKWLDLAPGFFGALSVLRHPGCNVAYWNLPHRPLSGPAEAPLAAGAPLHFFHFSGMPDSRTGTPSEGRCARSSASSRSAAFPIPSIRPRSRASWRSRSRRREWGPHLSPPA